ncbi:MAG: enoyl-CoA hydratase/isomerase family protein [Nocardioidaceae bacterium]
MSSTETTDRPPVRYGVDSGVATITLDRPNAMNSLNTAAKEALLSAVRQAAGDPDVRCVVVTGSGRAFSVGQDLKEHAERLATQSPDEVWSTVEHHYTPIALGLATMEKPVIAAVNGVAAGAGMSIAMACDLRIAADTAGFNTAFAAIALSCDTGSSWTLPRLVGPTKAVELLMMPRTLSSAEALELGLVNKVVPADELAAEVGLIAATLAVGPTLAYASLKESVAFAATHPLEEALAFESEMMARTGSSHDHRNAVRSFAAKEKPTFTGRWGG